MIYIKYGHVGPQLTNDICATDLKSSNCRIYTSLTGSNIVIGEINTANTALVLTSNTCKYIPYVVYPFTD